MKKEEVVVQSGVVQSLLVSVFQILKLRDLRREL